MKRLLINQSNIVATELDEIDAKPLQAGEARLSIKRFALTANNVTYAAAGFAIGYWKFFPSGVEGQGLVPVWGFADVVESRSDALEIGTRLYGFFPLADELVIVPEQKSDKLVVDAAEHRAELPPVYNRYAVVSAQDPEREALQSLLQPLLATSYLICDWLEDNAFFSAEQIIVGSASSKTGLGLCKYLSALKGHPVAIVGLTSERNAQFVQGLNACDSVVTYDGIETLPRIASVYVDMAGNADVKKRVHTHLGETLKHSSAVGTSHWDKFTPPADLPGPKPQFFFAPSQIEKRRVDWGPGEIEKRLKAAFVELAAEAGAWMDIRAHDGLDAAARVYAQIATGDAAPRDGHIIEL